VNECISDFPLRVANEMNSILTVNECLSDFLLTVRSADLSIYQFPYCGKLTIKRERDLLQFPGLVRRN
jgi:hypothetical protein